MKRYSNKSAIRNVRAVRSANKICFKAEIIHEAFKAIPDRKKKEAVGEIGDLIKKAWGEFSTEYLNESILHSKYLLLLRNEKDTLIGVAPIRELKINSKSIYSFGLTAVDPDFQGLGLMAKMHGILGKRVFVGNLFKGRTKIEFVFITPNIRTIGTLAKIADFVYPNPYLIDENGRLEDADEETWETVKHFLVANKETYRELDRNGCVMVGFYDDKPHLVKKIAKVPDKKLNDFAHHYLKPGNEVVVRSIIGLMGLIKSGY